MPRRCWGTKSAHWGGTNWGWVHKDRAYTENRAQNGDRTCTGSRAQGLPPPGGGRGANDKVPGPHAGSR